MWILALDAALARSSAAILADGAVMAQAAADGPRGHAAILPPLVRRVLAEAGVRADALDAVAAVVGPGGFTGLRAALALAQGIALSAGLPSLGVTTGEALAAALPPALRRARMVWSVVDNRRGRVILERFPPGADSPDGPPEAHALDALPEAGWPPALVGDAAPAVAERLRARGIAATETGVLLPDAADAARVAARRLAGDIPPLAALPLYVEPPAVRLPA
ncbi:tRNA (adenosine(37)-N6)-threonylcarbamoyltransferase complex dimerization subunit type 1 TsaB [Roseomonas sp. NAR14]|uniref:tRNA (Adenosine(37)-N6)-threonylcarbamoyltransferase complex dimerization subunit type 1 TsaB n=1 Tax=Roseomonas acroporae TaxID=2937791 RepID=A0A9X2BX81_9PROT|nr:tRNA (adenosine(37)-N6)-threonylcarbamoyltransferase complex dimerization subunit type 1 TsaB [Roseomonas acroporae]MCK8784710.1 tRNA (adenosine(37)-N6)-threonylcarbamoyltransferase complex dimerization subunit type 1 TsaB [Roseomonas acroporae]